MLSLSGVWYIGFNYGLSVAQYGRMYLWSRPVWWALLLSKCMCSAIQTWMPMGAPISSFKASISLLNFCICGLFRGKMAVMKSPTIIVLQLRTCRKKQKEGRVTCLRENRESQYTFIKRTFGLRMCLVTWTKAAHGLGQYICALSFSKWLLQSFSQMVPYGVST